MACLLLALPLAAGCGGSLDGLAYPGKSEVDVYALDLLNQYRAQAGVAPLTLDDDLSAFAFQGSVALAEGGAAHQHFIDAVGSGDGSSTPCGLSSENQAPGWPGSDAKAIVASMLQAMMDEGPGGGHHDAIVSPQYSRVGSALVEKDGLYYLTHDFGTACRSASLVGFPRLTF